MRSMATDPGALSRRGKHKVRNLFCGAFRVWATSLFGDFNFLRVVLREGLFDFSNKCRCARMLRDERQKAHRNGEEPKKVPDEILKQRAHCARQALKDAKKSQRQQARGNDISSRQEHQITLSESGELEKKMVAASKAYGFGKGAVPPMSREQAVIRSAHVSPSGNTSPIGMQCHRRSHWRSAQVSPSGNTSPSDLQCQRRSQLAGRDWSLTTSFRCAFGCGDFHPAAREESGGRLLP